MNFFKRRVRVPYGKVRSANQLRNNTTKNDWIHWKGYREQIRQVLEQTLAQKPGVQGHLLLLGAGNGNDVPIPYIESNFERITIVDIDEKALDRLLAKTAHPDKFSKVIIDLTGVGKEVHSLQELKEKVESLSPDIDFSKLNPPFDMVMNLCFSSQLISAFFYKEKNNNLYTPEFGAQLDRLIERIHVDLFEKLHTRLAPDGVVVHLTDVLLLQTLKKTGGKSPAKIKAEEVTQWQNRDIKGNLNLVHESLPDFAKQGLCLPGALVHLQAKILMLYRIRASYPLLWDFVDDDYEDRDYMVTVDVMEKK